MYLPSPSVYDENMKIFTKPSAPARIIGANQTTTGRSIPPGRGRGVFCFKKEKLMKLDRALQLSFLSELKNHYPNEYPVQRLSCFVAGPDFNANIIYLEEHGLISGKSQHVRQLENPGVVMLMAKITANGLDFLEGDGGLSAILNKVTIKFDADDLQVLIAARLDTAGVPPEKKSEIMKTIKSLPSEGIKAVHNKLLSMALDKLPNAIDLFEKILSQAT
jgi:hypothetical protein